MISHFSTSTSSQLKKNANEHIVDLLYVSSVQNIVWQSIRCSSKQQRQCTSIFPWGSSSPKDTYTPGSQLSSQLQPRMGRSRIPEGRDGVGVGMLQHQCQMRSSSLSRMRPIAITKLSMHIFFILDLKQTPFNNIIYIYYNEELFYFKAQLNNKK